MQKEKTVKKILLFYPSILWDNSFLTVSCFFLCLKTNLNEFTNPLHGAFVKPKGFGLGHFAVGHGHQLFKQRLTTLVNGLFAAEHHTGIKIDVVLHSLEGFAVAGHFDDGGNDIAGGGYRARW